MSHPFNPALKRADGADEAVQAAPADQNLRDAVLALNAMWNAPVDKADLAAQLDLCRRLALADDQDDQP